MFRDRIFRGVYPLALGQPLPANSAVKTGYVPIRSLKLYNEVHGRGESLVLLHGGQGSIEMLAEILPALAQKRQVIAVDLQAHGRTR